MTRRRYIWDSDLDCLVEIGAGSNHPDPEPSGVQIVRDIEPYRTAASDVAHEGKRSRHREFLRDNGYVEVGNERPISGDRPRLSQSDRIADIKRALGE